jgi:hypothetical protein
MVRAMNKLLMKRKRQPSIRRMTTCRMTKSRRTPRAQRVPRKCKILSQLQFRKLLEKLSIILACQMPRIRLWRPLKRQALQ